MVRIKETQHPLYNIMEVAESVDNHIFKINENTEESA